MNLIPKSHLAIPVALSKIAVSVDSIPREVRKLWDYNSWSFELKSTSYIYTPVLPLSFSCLNQNCLFSVSRLIRGTQRWKIYCQCFTASITSHSIYTVLCLLYLYCILYPYRYSRDCFAKFNIQRVVGNWILYRSMPLIRITESRDLTGNSCHRVCNKITLSVVGCSVYLATGHAVSFALKKNHV
jgi:hypothetical protein